MQSVSGNHRWPEPTGPPEPSDAAASAARRSADTRTTHKDAASQAILTLDEAAAFLRVSKYSVYRFIWAKKLHTIKVGRRRLVPMQSVHELVEHLRAEESV